MPAWKKVIVSGSDAALNSLVVSNGITGSLLGTASTASFVTGSNVYGPYGSNSVISASYAANGGVTQLLAGPNVILSPTNGLGQVTVSATLSGSTIFNTATGSYGSFYDTTTQTNPVADVPHSMSFNSTDITNGVSISGSTSPFNTYIKTQNAGVYNIQFSAQVDKTDGGTDDIVIWLRKNGIDLTDSATTLTLPTNNSKVVAAWNWFVTSATGDYYQIIWRSLDTDLRLLAEPISATHPGIPSVILTVNRVDQFLSNTGSFSGSFTGNLIGTASFAATASFVNTLTQSVLITGSAAIGTSSIGPFENTLTLGARDNANEGGQIGFNAPGGTYTSASFIDNWQNNIRILRGTNATSNATVASWNLHTRQMQLPAYTGASSFPGTATANLAVDSGGNVITVSTTGGSVFPYVGNAVITGSLTVTQPISVPINGGMYFQGGDDAALYDINISNHMGIYGVQDSTVGAIKLGSSGPVLYGSGSKLGIGTTNPSSASLTVNGNVWATSFTGSLLGTATTASYVLQAVSASYAPDTTFPYTGSALITGSLGITGSLFVIDGNGTSSLNTNVRTLYSSNGSSSIDWSNRFLKRSGVDVLDWRSLYAIDTSTSRSIDWGNRLLHDTSTSQSLDWTNRKLYDNNITPLLSVDWRTRDLTDTNESASLNWSSRALSDGIGVTSIDWGNRYLYDSNGVTSTEWDNRALKDSSGNNSINWENRIQYDSTNNSIIDYSGTAGLNIINLRPTIEVSNDPSQDEFIATTTGLGSIASNFAGKLIEVGPNIDLAVTASNTVFLDTDGVWKLADQSTDNTTKLLGICTNGYVRGAILIDGIVTVTTSSAIIDVPYVRGTSFYGMPVYLTGSQSSLTTTKPTSGYVRVVGHMYYNSTTTPDYWIMKFNPSNDWYEI